MARTKNYESAKLLNGFEIRKLGFAIQVLAHQNEILTLEERYYAIEGHTARDEEQRAELTASISEIALKQDKLRADIATINVEIEDLVSEPLKESASPTTMSFLDDLVGMIPPLVILITDDVKTSFAGFKIPSGVSSFLDGFDTFDDSKDDKGPFNWLFDGLRGAGGPVPPRD